jgi:hypothetical protein
MAIKYADHIDLGSLELQNAKLHLLATSPTGAKGLVYFNSTDNYPLYHDGTDWVRFGTVYSVVGGNGLTGNITTGGSLSVGAGDGISVSASAVAVDSTVVRTSGDQTIGGEKTFSDDVIIGGNLTVNGTVTTINTEQIDLADNIININSDIDGATDPTQDAGIVVNRGNESEAELIWNETTDRWTFNNADAYYNIPVPSEYNNFTYSLSTLGGANNGQKKIRLSGGGTHDDIIIAVSGLGISESGDTITISNTNAFIEAVMPAGETTFTIGTLRFGTAVVAAYNADTGEQNMVSVTHDPASNEVSVRIAAPLTYELFLVAQGVVA